jgi:glutamyl-Q tRNA(Asp) synthetase
MDGARAFARRFYLRMRYRGRFAPTPSGPLHFGSLVAAVGSYLEAKSHGGEWLLRIDDLDPPRVAPGSISAILHCLERFGFEWDGEVVFQSRRLDAYHGALHRLRRLGLVYPCSCSRSDIAAHGRRGPEGFVYLGLCRHGMPPGKTARTLRLRVQQPNIEIHDGLLGVQACDLVREAGDFVLYRSDRIYAFHLAAAVDDAAYGITDIVRGADLLHSSARQLYLQRVLELPGTAYVHLPVATNTAGEKLSKQTGAPPVDPANPVPILCQALSFLNQPPPPEPDALSLYDLWRFARSTWSLQRVEKVRQKPATV